MPQSTEVPVDDLYASLDVETRIVVQQRTSEIKTLMRRTAQDIVDIGQKLIEVKERLGHGVFGAWLPVEFGWSRTTAVRFMRVAEQFKFANLANLSIASSALYLLAESSTPESARQEALQRAEQGEHITYRGAQEMVAAQKAMPMLEGHVGEDRYLEGGSRQSGQVWVDLACPEQPPSMLVSEMPRDVVVMERQATGEAYQATHKMAVHFSSQTVEHYTPETIIAPTVACLGEIDLDPCSDGGEPPNVPAHTHYTAADDGLTHPWHGRVYMNPPYGREIGDWVEKLCAEHEAGRVTEAIALLPSRTDTQWWRRLRMYLVCFVQGRLTFVGSQDPAPFPSAVFYLGQDTARFCCAFGQLGDIYRRIETEEQR